MIIHIIFLHTIVQNFNNYSKISAKVVLEILIKYFELVVLRSCKTRWRHHIFSTREGSFSTCVSQCACADNSFGKTGKRSGWKLSIRIYFGPRNTGQKLSWRRSALLDPIGRKGRVLKSAYQSFSLFLPSRKWNTSTHLTRIAQFPLN